MKNLSFFLLIALCISCAEKKPTHSPEQEVSQASPDFDWLLGNWARQNDPEGKQTFEHWRKKSESEYLGLGYTLEEQDTTWKENIRLIEESGTWRFEVSGEGSMTSFRVSDTDSVSFVCENPDNEFPKKISYTRVGDKVNALISGGDMEIPFLFNRIPDESK